MCSLKHMKFIIRLIYNFSNLLLIDELVDQFKRTFSKIDGILVVYLGSGVGATEMSTTFASLCLDKDRRRVFAGVHV